MEIPKKSFKTKLMSRFHLSLHSRWKKDNKLPNTKNVKKKNADGSVTVTPGTGKGKGKRGGGKKSQQQQQQTSQSEVKMEIFKDEDFHSML